MADGYGRIPRWVVHQTPNIGTTALAVYVVLADHCNERRYCRPSYTTLQDETGLSRTGLSEAMKKLYSIGAVRKTEGEDSRSKYHLPMEPTFTESTQATGSPRLPIKAKPKSVESTEATGSLSRPVASVDSTGSLGLPPSEQEPRTRTKKSSTVRTWPYSEPPVGTPMHVVWSIESRRDGIIVLADLGTELKHIKTMLESGIEERHIVNYWDKQITDKPEYALPRFMLSRVSAWLASHKGGNNGHKPGANYDPLSGGVRPKAPSMLTAEEIARASGH